MGVCSICRGPGTASEVTGTPEVSDGHNDPFMGVIAVLGVKRSCHGGEEEGDDAMLKLAAGGSC